MARGVRLYLVGSFVLVSLAGCGRGFFQAEREPWRAEAEVACLKSGAVREGADLVRIEPISGPGVCGAQFPLKVTALGESPAAFGYTDELRPPGSIGSAQPRWPITQAPAARPSPQSTYSGSAPRQPNYGAPGVAAPDGAIDLPAESMSQRAGQSYEGPAQPQLGPARGDPVAAVGPVAMKPTATLACPIVSALDRWLADSVQPAAQRWFGARVVEIKQISAYSCRGMNGNPNAHISEHAFGNALDIAAFTLADGRRITVKDGWRGMPEEQGFLRDVQAAACQQFNTVLAPGSNRHHYDHIHVDLMRRASGRVICQPGAASGEEIAARAGYRNSYASRGHEVTGSLGGRYVSSRKARVNEEDEFEDH